MTSIEVETLPLKAARREFIYSWVQAVATVRTGASDMIWVAIAEAIIREAGGLYSSANQWWPRRIINLRKRIDQDGVEPRVAVIAALTDMQFANENDGR